MIQQQRNTISHNIKITEVDNIDHLVPVGYMRHHVNSQFLEVHVLEAT